MQKQKAMPFGRQGFIQIILPVLVLLIIAGVGVYYYFVVKPGRILTNTGIVPQYQQDYQQSANSVATVKSGADLNTVSADLDSSDLTQIDTELNSLSLDAVSF
jgi:flagellar basal body-associated protein FliL